MVLPRNVLSSARASAHGERSCAAPTHVVVVLAVRVEAVASFVGCKVGAGVAWCRPVSQHTLGREQCSGKSRLCNSSRHKPREDGAEKQVHTA